MDRMCYVMGYISGYVNQDYVAFRVMSFGIMSHSELCCIWYSVVVLNVVLDVIQDYVVRYTVGVSMFSMLIEK